MRLMIVAIFSSHAVPYFIPLNVFKFALLQAYRCFNAWCT